MNTAAQHSLGTHAILHFAARAAARASLQSVTQQAGCYRCRPLPRAEPCGGPAGSPPPNTRRLAVAGTHHHFAMCLTDLGAGRGRTWGSRPLPGWLRAALAAPPPAQTCLQATLPGQREPAPRPWLPATQRAVSQARPARSGLLLLSLRSARTSADPADPVAGAAHCAAAPGTGRGCTAGACAALSGPGAPCSASLGVGARRSRGCAGSGAAIRTGDQGSAWPVDRVWTCSWRCCFQEQQRDLNCPAQDSSVQSVANKLCSREKRAHSRVQALPTPVAHGSQPVGQRTAVDPWDR